MIKIILDSGILKAASFQTVSNRIIQIEVSFELGQNLTAFFKAEK